MSKSVNLSKFNPAVIPPSRLNFNYIEMVNYDRVTGDVVLKMKDGSLAPIGSYLPKDATDVEGVALVDGRLVISLSNDEMIDVGDLTVTDTTIYPEVTGLGLLSGSGVYKPLVSTTSELEITEENDKVILKYLLPDAGGEGAPIVGTTLEAAVFASEVLVNNGSGAVSAGATIANTWFKRLLTTISFNETEATLNNGGLLLTKGHYYVEASSKAYKTGKAQLAIETSAGVKLLMSQTVAAVRDSSSDISLSGYFYLPTDDTVNLMQYSELASQHGKGYVMVGGNFGSNNRLCKVSFWKVSDSAPVNEAPAPFADYSQSALDWQELYEERKDVTYTGSTMPAAAIGGIQATVNIVHGNVTYFIHNTLGRPYMTKYDSVTKESYPIELPANVADALYGGDYSWWCTPIYIRGKYYLIPYTAKFVAVFDPVTETFMVTNYGLNMTGGRKWPHAVYVPAVDKIFCSPIDAGGFLVIDLKLPTYKTNYSTIPDLQNGMVGGFVVTSGGLHDGRYPPQKAFNNTIATTEQDSWISQNGPAPTDADPHWIQVEYPVGIEITSWTIQNSSNAGVVQALKGALKGSFDGVTWTTLDTWEVTKASLVPMALRPSRQCSNVAAYKFYRMDFYKNSGEQNFVYIPRLYLMSTDPSKGVVAIEQVVDTTAPEPVNSADYYMSTPDLQNGMVGGFVVTASGVLSGSYLPQRAFNNTAATTDQDSWVSQNGPAPSLAVPHWIQIEYPVGTEVTAWTMQNNSAAGLVQATKGALKGSFDGVNWVVLDSWEVPKASLKVLGFRLARRCSNVAAYKFYRMDIYKNSGERDYVLVPRLHLLTSDASRGYAKAPLDYTSSATIETFGLTGMTSGNKFGGIALANNGSVYATPYDSANIVKINPVAMTAVYVPTTYTGANKWLGAYYSPEQNKIVAMPYTATQFLLIDCSNDSYTISPLGVTLPTGNKYLYNFYDSVKHQVCANPLAAISFLFVDLATLTAKLVTNSWGFPANSWYAWSGVSTNRKISAMLIGDLTKIYEIDADNYAQSIHWSGMANLGPISALARYAGTALGGDGRAYALPCSANAALVTDGIAIYPIESARLSATSQKYLGSVGYDGDIYGVPAGATAVLKIATPKTVDGVFLGTERELAAIVGGIKYYQVLSKISDNIQNNMVVIADSSYPTYRPVQSFDVGLSSTPGGNWYGRNGPAPTPANPCWIGVILPTPAVVTAYAFQNVYSTSIAALEGSLQGSHDGITWVTLHDYAYTPASTVVYAMRPIESFQNSVAYGYYRLLITKSNGAAYVGVGRLFLLSTEKYDVTNKIGAILPVKANAATLEAQQNLTIAQSMQADLIAPAGTDKWYKGAFIPATNKIYFCPFNRADIGILDPVAGTLTQSNFGYSFSGTHLLGGTNDDGKMLLVGRSTNALVLVDTVAGTAKSVVSGERGVITTQPHWGGSWGIDDRMHLTPYLDQKIAVFDPADSSAFTTSGMTAMPNTVRLCGSTVASNGKTLMMPYGGAGHAPYMYDPFQVTMDKVAGTYAVGAAGHDSVITLPNGYSVALPHSSTLTALVFKPSSPCPVPLNMLLDPKLNRS